jgi:hypothetical protein
MKDRYDERCELGLAKADLESGEQKRVHALDIIEAPMRIDLRNK